MVEMGEPRPVRREVYDSYVTRLLPPQNGVCDCCCQPADCDFCDSCAEGLDALNLPRAAVLPIALRPRGTQLRNLTWQYKHLEDAEQRSNAEHALTQFLGRFLLRHEACAADNAGVESFDMVTWVPSSPSNQRGYDPVQRLLLSGPWAARPANAGRVTHLLTDTGRYSDSHHVHRDWYVADGAVRGRTVLVVDDTWTHGGHVLSAFRALSDAGSRGMAAIVIGRTFDQNYSEECRDYFSRAGNEPFTPRFCQYCDPRP